MKQAASLNRVKLAYGNYWNITKIRTLLRLPEKKTFLFFIAFKVFLKRTYLYVELLYYI